MSFRDGNYLSVVLWSAVELTQGFSIISDFSSNIWYPIFIFYTTFGFFLVIILKRNQLVMALWRTHGPSVATHYLFEVIMTPKDRSFSTSQVLAGSCRSCTVSMEPSYIYSWQKTILTQMNSLHLGLWENRQNTHCKSTYWSSAAVSKDLNELTE